MKANEISSLYRSYSPKMSQYFPDGAGRDTYINYNNGGFWTQGVKRYNTNMSNKDPGSKYNFKSLRKHVAPFKYFSDGSGRDSYVIFESGGLKKDHKALNQFHLKDFLRTPESCIFNFRKNPSRDGVSAKTVYVSKAEYECNNEIKKIQNGVIKRLYTNEKHKFINGNKTASEGFFNSNSNSNSKKLFKNSLDNYAKLSSTRNKNQNDNLNNLPSISLENFKLDKNKNSNKSSNNLMSLDNSQNMDNVKHGKTDVNFFNKNIYKINNYEYNKKEFNKAMNNMLHLKTQK